MHAYVYLLRIDTISFEVTRGRLLQTSSAYCIPSSLAIEDISRRLFSQALSSDRLNLRHPGVHKANVKVDMTDKPESKRLRRQRIHNFPSCTPCPSDRRSI